MNRPASQNSELGPIPADWEVKPLGQIAPLQRGFDLPTSALAHGTVPVVYSNGILNFHETGLCNAPGLVTGRSGTIGKFTFIERGTYWPHNTTLWVTSFCGNDPKFVYYLYSRIGFERFSGGTGVPTLNRNDLHAYQVAIPTSVDEQRRIAAALSDADAWIESLDKLIEKKKLVKQGAMQELLSGQTRLPGFSGKWEERRLGECMLVNPPNDRQLPEKFFYVDLESVTKGRLSEVAEIAKADAPSRAQRLFQKEDILFQTVRPYQNNNLFVDFDADRFVASTGYAILRANCGTDARLVFEIIQTPQFTNQVMDNCTGTGYPAINPGKLSEISFSFPVSLAEQRAIASVLSDMDAEVAALTREKAKAEQIKQGMMQELLTGRTRLAQGKGA